MPLGTKGFLSFCPRFSIFYLHICRFDRMSLRQNTHILDFSHPTYVEWGEFQPRTSHKPDIAFLSPSIYIKSLLSALGDSDPENRIHSHHCSIMHTPKGLLPSITRLRLTRKASYTYLRSTRRATKPTQTALVSSYIRTT